MSFCYFVAKITFFLDLLKVSYKFIQEITIVFLEKLIKTLIFVGKT